MSSLASIFLGHLAEAAHDAADEAGAWRGHVALARRPGHRGHVARLPGRGAPGPCSDPRQRAGAGMRAANRTTGLRNSWSRACTSTQARVKATAGLALASPAAAKKTRREEASHTHSLMREVEVNVIALSELVYLR
jgi:hypothetical protein